MFDRIFPTYKKNQKKRKTTTKINVNVCFLFPCLHFICYISLNACLASMNESLYLIYHSNVFLGCSACVLYLYIIELMLLLLNQLFTILTRNYCCLSALILFAFYEKFIYMFVSFFSLVDQLSRH